MKVLFIHFRNGFVVFTFFPRCIFLSFFRFARVCSNVDEFNNRNLFLTAKLLKQGYRNHKLRKAFSKFYHRQSE